MSNLSSKQKIIEIQKAAIGDILTLAEIGLSPFQFRQFKKKVFEVYHQKLRPETIELLDKMQKEKSVL